MTQANAPTLSPIICAGDLALDPWSRTLFGPKGAEQISKGQFIVMHALMRRPGAPIDKSHLISLLWPDDDEPEHGENILRNHILQLRRTMDRIGVSGDNLTLEFTVGYRLKVGRYVVRVMTPAQAAMVDKFLASHAEQLSLEPCA